MDIRFIAWAGYEFDYTEGATAASISLCPPEINTNIVGRKTMTGSVLPRDISIKGSLIPKVPDVIGSEIIKNVNIDTKVLKSANIKSFPDPCNS